jgi:hypothetical protein
MMFRVSLSCLLLAFVISCTENQVEPSVDCDIEGPQLSILATPSECVDATGSVTVNPEGGTSPFSYEINAVGIEENETGIFLSLPAGNYEVTVTDANGCSATASTSVASAEGPSIDSVESTDAGCGTAQGTLTATASGGEGVLSFSLDGGMSSASNVFSGLTAGTYELVVSDENGCETLEQVQVLSGISLSNDITPIITENCYGSTCHNSGRSPDFTTPTNIIANADRILARTSAGTMPPTDALSSGLVDQIACWVNDNAPEN